MTTPIDPTRKEAWIAPEIRTLDITGTELRINRGNDSGRFLDCTRS